MTKQGLAPEGDVCTIREKGSGVVEIESSTTVWPPRPMPECFLEVLEEWGCRWMWGSLRLYGEDNWLEDSIRADNCMAVTDGLYIKELYLDVCSAAFVFECTVGRGVVVGLFEEQSSVACPYRGELLGLLAIPFNSAGSEQSGSGATR